jgi:purine nucleosidase
MESGAAGGPGVRIVHDGDHGIDDAVATLFLLLRSDVEVIAIGTVHGNAHAAQAASNALQLIEVAGRSGVPVAVGAARPLVQPADVTGLVHGRDGLGGHAVPHTAGLVGVSAAEQLVRLARAEPGALTVVATGPLTNIALALLLEPRLPRLLRRLVVMGGAVEHPGNITAVAEANIAMDPEAAALVLAAGFPLTLVPLDTTMATWWTADDVARIAAHGAPLTDLLTGVLAHYLDFYARQGGVGGCPLHDPTAAVVAVDPSVVTRTVTVPVGVELAPGRTRGMLLVDRRPFAVPDPAAPVTDVVLAADRDRVTGQLLDVLLR